MFEAPTGHSAIFDGAAIDATYVKAHRSLIQAAGPFRRLLADRGYDANHLRELLAQRGAEAVIPSTTSRTTPIPYDTDAYRDRNRVERM